MYFSKAYRLIVFVMLGVLISLLFTSVMRSSNQIMQQVLPKITNQKYWYFKTHFTEMQSQNELVRRNIPSPHVQHINCQKLANGNKEEIIKAEKYQESMIQNSENNSNISIRASDCNLFIKQRHYAMKPLAQEEADFPIAYNILMFKDPDQVERLLRAIYRPQNYYCIHIDKKSSKEIFEIMRVIIKCFDNVFLASQSIDVQWGDYSVLEPELVCMKDLWAYTKWKYVINLTGQEFPLKTNLEIVKILKALNGANLVDATIKRRNKDRTELVHPGRKLKKSKCPVNVTLAKGAVHVILKREFVDYILHNKTALIFRDWLKDTGHPDETFFNSLNHSPQLKVPGAYKGEPEVSPKYPSLSRVKNWYDSLWKCQGKNAKSICIFGVGDLQHLMNKHELFANKFHKDYHPLGYDCLEEIHFNMTREEVLGTRIFNTSYYENLNVAHNHLT